MGFGSCAVILGQNSFVEIVRLNLDIQINLLCQNYRKASVLIWLDIMK